MPRLRTLLPALLAAFTGLGVPALACTTGDVRIFALSFCPRDFAPLDGALIAPKSNPALFSLLGTTYGGDGTNTFALPDLRGRSVIGSDGAKGQGMHPLGDRGGAEEQSLTVQQMPVHSHNIQDRTNGRIRAQGSAADSNNPNGAFLAMPSSAQIYTKNAGVGVSMNADSVDFSVSGTTDQAGAGQSFPVRDPYLALTACLCVRGVFPAK